MRKWPSLEHMPDLVGNCRVGEMAAMGHEHPFIEWCPMSAVQLIADKFMLKADSF
jgi:hypothetical protein